MKVVIIGGGIAGLSLGLFLHKNKISVVINERSVGIPTLGHAFLMHSDGLNILRELTGDKMVPLPGNVINSYSLRRPDGAEIKRLHLKSWKCIKRRQLISFLYSLYPVFSHECIREGRAFSHFIYREGRIIAAAFLNGDVEYGDVFVGADGGNSRVRELIFGRVHFTPVTVKEVVGVAYNEKIGKTHPSIFTKFQHRSTGLAFGFIPISHIEFVWFLQYDPAISDVTDSTPEELRSFCFHLLENFPAVVGELLDSSDFTTSYIWNTRDFDLLPAFHKDNVVLMGDAAHLALPFTSAGTTNALADAKMLSMCLVNNISDYQKAFREYYQERSGEVASHVTLGRELKKIFLNPKDHNEDDIPVPLIPQKKDDAEAKRNKPIQVIYFTDPICSTCWIIQPLLRKLQLEYGEYLNIEYRMGGLLPSWEEYNKGKIAKPSDAAKHWEEVCVLHEMPLDGDIWEEDPLNSSYPPSIAFKAAQLQDTNKAILFLRRIKEMVFLEKKNIIKWEFLENAAFEVGLDSARLQRDFEGRAKDLFREDLMLAADLGVVGFPTLFFEGKDGQRFSIKGYQPYKNFEDIIYRLIPGAQKETVNTDPEALFSQFQTMTDKEFALLSNVTREEASKRLRSLHESGFLDKYESKNGIIWIGKFDPVTS